MLKKRNRVFRQRRPESSDEEDDHKTCQSREEETVEESEVGPARYSQLHQRRGLSCTSKPKKEHVSPASGGDYVKEREEEDHGSGAGNETAPSDEKRHLEVGLLSFEDDRGDEAQGFKIRKPAVNAVVFKSQKKKESHSLLEVKKENLKGYSEEAKKDKSLEDGSNDGDSEGENISMENEDGESSSSSSSSSSESSSSGTKSSEAADIPDAKCIQAARRKRQLARARADFIPLNTGQNYGNQWPNQKMDSDAESESDEDEQRRRIQFAPKIKGMKQRTAENIGRSKSSDDLQDTDSEAENTWEEQQIRKGIKIPQVSSRDSANKSMPHSFMMKVESVSLPVVSLETVKRKLSNRLKSLQEIHRSHRREHEKVLQVVNSSEDTIAALEESGNGGQRYKFYKEMMLYIQNLVDCLSEKIIQIDALESEMHQIYQKQAAALLKRRKEDISTESAYIQRLSNTTGSFSSGLDGHDDKAQNLLEACWSRRRQRREAREGTRENKEHHEGMSSDDEQPPVEVAAFHDKKETILRDAEKVFEDVHEEFHGVNRILLKFAQWRQQFFDSYSEAYISLCLPKLLNPLIRLQLIKWNPLELDYLDWEEMPWFQEIKKFSHPPVNMMEPYREEHPDAKVLTSVLEKAVVPKVIGFVELVWDPLSSSQTNRLVQLYRRLQEHCLFEDDPSKVKQSLLNSILLKTRKSIDEDVFIPMYSKSHLVDRMSPQSKFQDRQLWAAVKLLGNIIQWDGLIPKQPLQELGLDKLLNRYIVITLLNMPPGTDNVQKCRKVIASFPESWFKDLKDGDSLPQLYNLSRHLLQTAHALNVNCSENTCVRETQAEVVQLLKKIKALEYAETIVQQYNLQDFKEGLRK
ncbi:intron Large complex component GCFC2 [Protopterus annectens]|uniref:intron Large complex component GCFC2 n=1 Tax=Protopterus annectens TaxID=7888 RepID=UPI001CFB8A93|nr:intron Large complex component GCFC2 [Protopterus annectens]